MIYDPDSDSDEDVSALSSLTAKSPEHALQVGVGVDAADGRQFHRSVSSPPRQTEISVQSLKSHSFDLYNYGQDSRDVSAPSSGASTPHPGSPSPRSSLTQDSISRAFIKQRLFPTEYDQRSVSGEESGYDETTLVRPTRPGNLENKQLYLMLARCISFPFNAKYQLETSPPHQKLNATSFKQIRSVLESLRDGAREWYQETMLTPAEQRFSRDTHFLECVDWYLDNVLQREDLVRKCESGELSVKELEYIFKVCATKQSTYSGEARRLETTELQTWHNTFRKLVEQSYRVGSSPRSHHPPLTQTSSSYLSPVGTSAPNPDKLYKLFQEILKVKSIEHKALYRACQLGDKDHQEAVARRELQARKIMLEDNSTKLTEGRFGSHRMEQIYREEQLKMVKLLNTNLDQLSLSGSGFTPTTQKRRNVMSETGNIALTKQDLQLKLQVNVTIHEVCHLPNMEGKPVFCVFELVGGSDSRRTEPVIPEYGLAQFDEGAEFRTQSPLPEIKLSLCVETKGLFSDAKILAKKIHQVTPTSSETNHTLELVQSDKDASPFAAVKISTFLEKPQNMKKSGYLSCSGDFMFKQQKRRFLALMQLSQYKFLLCTYYPNSAQPKETLLLSEGFTVEYPSGEEKGLGDPDYKYMFVLVAETAEMGRLRFGCRDDSDRQSWVKWLVRATGQTDKPQNDTQDEQYDAFTTDLERYGLTEVVNLDIRQLDPHALFIKLFRITLEYRLKENLFSRGLFSPSQMYVIDEFCARYGVRDAFRHLTCLKEWLGCERRGVSIWPVMFLSSFRFCQMHVGGMNPPERSAIVTKDEQEALIQISQELEDMVVQKLENFRTCFPFGCPKDDLKVTIKLFNLVSSMNHSNSPGSEDFPLKILTLCMERAALINYKLIFSQLNHKDENAPLTLDLAMKLAHFCISFMYELHDFYWEDFSPVATVFTSHVDAFWSFYLVDLREAMRVDDTVIVKLQLFHTVNQYFCSQPTMKLGQFHRTFLDEFAPVVIGYVKDLDASLKVDLSRTFGSETWTPVRQFVTELNWPDEGFAREIESVVQGTSVARFKEAADFTSQELQHVIQISSITLSYKLPSEVFTMLNTLVTLNTQIQVCALNGAFPLVESGMNIEDYLSYILQSAISIVIEKLCETLSMVLGKLAKYDPSDSVLASLKMFLSSNAPLSGYNQFVSDNLEKISECLVAPIFNNFLVNWYECQLQIINQWLTDRPGYLHTEQSRSVQTLLNATHEQFANLDISEEKLSSETYLTIDNRLRMEHSRLDLESVDKN